MDDLLTFLFFFIAFFLNQLQNTQPAQGESIPILPCPKCGSHHTVKNGSVHNGKPKRLCKDCGRQFVLESTKHMISQATKQLIDKLLLERIFLRGIARVTSVSLSWLQNYVNDKLGSVPQQVKVTEKPGASSLLPQHYRCEYAPQGADIHLFLAQQALATGDRSTALAHARQAQNLATCDGPPDYTYKVAYDEALEVIRCYEA